MRRLHTVKGNLTLFLLFLLLAFALQVRASLTETLAFHLYPIPLMIVVYLGYKFGRWPGLAAGVLISAFWTVSALIRQPAPSWTDVLWRGMDVADLCGGGLCVFGYALQDVVLIGLLGFVSGVLFDALDKVLADCGTSLDELMPSGHGSYLGAIYRLLGRWFRRFGPEESSDGKAAGRRAWAGRIAVVPLAVILALLNLSLSFSIAYMQLRFPPLYLNSLLILVFAFMAGSRAGVTLAVMVWAVSNLMVLGLLFGEAGDFDLDGLRFDLSVGTPAQAVGLGILAWWFGKAGAIWRNEDARSKLGGLLSRRTAPAAPKPIPSYLLVIVLLLASLGLRYASETLEIRYYPILALFLVVSAWSQYCDETLSSNRTLMTLLAFAMVYVIHPVAESWWMQTAYLDLCDVLLLALTPLAFARLDLRQRADCRLAAFGFLVAITLPDIYLRGDLVPIATVAGLWLDGESMRLFSWLVTIATFAAASSVLHWVVDLRQRPD